jgi:hypothetical protein
MQGKGKRIKGSLEAVFVPLLLVAAASQAPTAMAQSPGAFTAIGDMTTPRIGHTATLLTDGTVLIVGGFALSGPGGAALSSAELYDPSTGTFTATGTMTTPRLNHTASLLPDGKVLIAGGSTGEFLKFSLLASAELYDPATKTFTSTGEMTMGRSGHAAILLMSGRVLIVGHYVGAYTMGRPTDPTAISAELYDPSTRTFMPAGNLVGPGGGATLLASGKVLISPGYYDIRPIQNEIYDPLTGTFSATVNQSSCCESTATLLMNGNVLVAYGLRGPDVIAELYDPASGTFTTATNPTMETYRGGQTATLLADGSVLLAGGSWGEVTPNIVYSADAEIYDPAARTFSTTGRMHASRWSHTATLLNDGRVLIAGGVSFVGSVSPDMHSAQGGTKMLSSAELYTPAVLAGPPVLLSLSGDRNGYGAILHAGTHEVVSSNHPASPGEPLEIYLTGLPDGSVISPQIAIGGRMAEILFFGNLPGFAGLNQVNIRVPSGIGPGSAVPVRLTYIGRASNEVTIAVQ